MPVIPVMREAKIRRTVVLDQPGQKEKKKKSLQDPISMEKKALNGWVVTISL
jgi:hypothetical protein